MRFSASVSILFKEVPFLERFGRARDAGFSAVEFWWPGHEADIGAGLAGRAALETYVESADQDEPIDWIVCVIRKQFA